MPFDLMASFYYLTFSGFTLLPCFPPLPQTQRS